MSDDITLGEAVQSEYEAWERAQLLDVRKQLEEAKVRSQIAALHNDTELTPGLAAIFTGRSERNLRELRGTKSGPAYTQPETDSTARNQKITYRLAHRLEAGQERDFQSGGGGPEDRRLHWAVVYRSDGAERDRCAPSCGNTEQASRVESRIADAAVKLRLFKMMTVMSVCS